MSVPLQAHGPSYLVSRRPCPAHGISRVRKPIQGPSIFRRPPQQYEYQDPQVPCATAAAVGMPEDNSKNYTPQFIARRFFLFSGLVLGYSFYYLTRNSLTYTAPVMVADPLLNMDITQIGAMTSIFPLAYGTSKFLSGVLGAKISPRVLLAGGLMATATVNILFGFQASLFWFCILWGLNGTLQGLGGPCCARMLTSWFASKERGTFWGMWNIAHNLGGFMAPIIAGTAAREFGWRWGMWVPGIMGMVMGLYVLVSCADSPEALGYPPVEAPEVKVKTDEKEEKPSLLKMLVENVLKNGYIWCMAFTYFFIYIIRQGVTSWSVFYLMQAKGIKDVGTAGVLLSGLELGGLAGSLLAGRLSDQMIANAKEGEGFVGKRVQVVLAYTVGIAAMLASFRVVPGGVLWAQWAVVFMIGFCLYGPQMLIGLCGAELVGPDSVGASEGFLGWIAYFGAANAGIPLAFVVKQYGWNAYFATLIGACVMACVLLAPMVNLKSHVQRETLRLAKLAKEKDI